MSQRRANRDQVFTPSRTRAPGPRDRRLARVLAGWLGQVPGVLHRDDDEETDSYKEKGENMIVSAGFGAAEIFGFWDSPSPNGLSPAVLL